MTTTAGLPSPADPGASTIPPAAPPVALHPGAPAELRQRFQSFSDLLRHRGVLAGTSHNRITIPKAKLTEPDIKSLGFEPVMIAIPEAGQDRFRSFRHPDNNFHIHSHGDRWTMHEDRFPAATMIARRMGAAKAFVQGMPHVFTEGVPGLANYLKGQLYRRRSTADNVAQELSPDVLAQISSMPDSPTAKTAALLEARLKARRRGWHYEAAPGFHDLRGKFEDAARKGLGREVKLADAEAAAMRDVLAKFGFLRGENGEDDPVGVLAKVLRNADFGFGLPARDAHALGRRPGGGATVAPWGPKAGLTSGSMAANQSPFNAAMSYSGV